MSKRIQLPRLRMSAKPSGLAFRPTAESFKRWDISLKAKSDQKNEIDIMTPIGDPMWGGVDAATVKKQLAALGPVPVTVFVNSPGGDAFEGVAIYNILREHAGKVNVKVLGLAASAASIIAMAGDTIEMGEGAFMMIHSAWGAVAGNHNDMREFADVLEGLSNSVAELYARRTGQSVKDVTKMMDKETWLGGAQAVELGFADATFADEQSAAPQSRTAAMQTRAAAPLALLGQQGGSGIALMQATTIPGVPDRTSTSTLRNGPMDIASMIASLESKRTATQARMQALNELVAKENRTKADEERTEYRGLQAELTQIDEELVDQREFQRAQLSNATEISAAAGTSVAVGAQTRGGSTSVVNAASIQAAAQAHQHSGIVAVRPNVEKGIAFTRYVRALCMARGSPVGALAIAENNQNWKDTTPQVAKVLMAAVAAGDTTTAGWASELVYNQSLISEFMEYLRPQTILGKLPQMTRVPFNIRMAGQTSGSTAYWVGQGKPVPVSKLTTTDLTLGIAKAEGLVVLTEELVRSSDPSAELLVRNDLTASIAAFLDVQFISPDYAAVANVSPASITSGVAPTAATAATAAALRTDVQTLFATWIANNLDPSSGAWIMTATQALAISLMLNSLGQPVFPDITMNGGTFFGLPVIVSQAAKQVGSPVSGEGNLIVLVNQKEILFADDGQVTIDASREASLEMLDNPTNQSVPSVTPTTQVSMFQTSSVAIKATRFINWKKRRDFAVAYIKDAAYVS